MNRSSALKTPVRLLLAAIAMAGLISLAGNYHAQNQGARTESSMKYDQDGSLVTTQTDYDAQNRVVETRELKGGKLRKRTRYTWPKDFKKPNTSTTEYHPDGTTPSSTTNSDVDKAGNPTSTVTTNYDATGKETGGSKRETDATGKEHCYNWNPSKQVYEEVECAKKPWVSSVDDNNPKVETGGGLIKVDFNLEGGRVIVNLPDDMRAGDTISGTVVEEPKGANQTEKEKNRKTLEGMVIDLEGTKVNVGQPRFTWTPPMPQPSIPQPRYQLRIIEIPPGSPAKEHVYFDCFIPEYEAPKLSAGARDNVIESTDIKIPTLGQAGRPIVITGPFDGNSDNTTVQLGGQQIAPLAESPRKVVVQTPLNVIGPTQITVKEANKETKGDYRNVKVDLTAPKTSLRRGESTELHVEVSGLQGITQAAPLRLTKGGVVTMQGGDVQTMSIKPSEVRPNGTFTTSRTITGQQTGAFSVTATVVVFDACLEDDGDPLRVLLFNVSTGDFSFCHGPDGAADNRLYIHVPANITQNGEPTGPPDSTTASISNVIRNGTFTSADFKFSAGQMHIELNRGDYSGTATIKLSNPNRTLTIHDRDTRNNTCACK